MNHFPHLNQQIACVGKVLPQMKIQNVKNKNLRCAA
jgi:hypothetical protein